ncbi:MAG: ACP S-malonyltransferase [Ignavibacteriales bacterium]
MHFAFLFPGQGAQHPGMGSGYLQEFPYIKEYFLEASEVLNFDILDLCLNGTEDSLNLTANAQPSILTLSYCAFQILQKETEIKPFLMAGHSLGEISALCCAGAISFPDALSIVRKRGELMQLAVNKGDGAMLALNGLSLSQVQELCASGISDGKAVVSNINSANQIVISGLKENVEAIGSRARELGAITIPLKVSAPFHSPLMKPAAISLEAELNNYKFTRLKYPVISNVTCKPYMDENEIIPLLTEQVTTVVNWQKIMEYIEKTRVTSTLELLPKKTLTRLFKGNKSLISSYTFDQLEELKNLSNIEHS